jgi:murein DD-endopeptidase MepM/ murein hydrolase activator NlpD
LIIDDIKMVRNPIVKLLFFVAFSLTHFLGFNQKIIDTISTPNGDIVLYSNRTWEYLKDKGFDGILNQGLYANLKLLTTNEFSQSWDNQKCFTASKTSDPTKLTDTLWLNVNDPSHLKFVMPVPGVKTSPFGPRWGRNHNGVDLNLNTGDTVLSAWDGKVRYAKFNEGGFGNLVIVRHYNGLETFYAHLSKLLVQPNDEVKAGDVLGLGGNTGHSYGPHLHFEVRFFDSPINPEVFVDVVKKELKVPRLYIHKSLFAPESKPVEYVAPPKKEEIAKKPTPTKPKPTVKKDKVVYYKVKSGDNLSKIAARYGTTVSALCKLNGIKSSTPLRAGKSLRVK